MSSAGGHMARRSDPATVRESECLAADRTTRLMLTSKWRERSGRETQRSQRRRRIWGEGRGRGSEPAAADAPALPRPG